MKKLLLFLLLTCLSCSAQFAKISNGPISGNCAGPSFGLDQLNSVLYICTNTNPGTVSYQWVAVNGSGSGMTWPTGAAGVPNYNGAQGWGSTYNALNPIPANFVTGGFVLTNPFATGIVLSDGTASGGYAQSNATIDSSGNAIFGGSVTVGGSVASFQLQGFNASDPVCGGTGFACIYTLAGTPNKLMAQVDGGSPFQISASGGGATSGTPVIQGARPNSGGSNGFSNYTFEALMEGGQLNVLAATFKITFQYCGGTGVSIHKAVIKRTIKGSLTVVDTTNITFNSGSSTYDAAFGFTASCTATWTPAYVTSDSVSLQLDSSHDYYIMEYLDADGVYNSSIGIGALGSSGVMIGYYSSGDHTGDSTVFSLYSQNLCPVSAVLVP